MSSEVIKRHSWFIRLGAPYKGHRDLMREAIRGHQRPSEAIRGAPYKGHRDHRKLELFGEEHVVPRPFDR